MSITEKVRYLISTLLVNCTLKREVTLSFLWWWRGVYFLWAEEEAGGNGEASTLKEGFCIYRGKLFLLKVGSVLSSRKINRKLQIVSLWQNLEKEYKGVPIHFHMNIESSFTNILKSIQQLCHFLVSI